MGGDADLSLFETALSLLTYMGTWSASQGWEARRMPSSAHRTSCLSRPSRQPTDGSWSRVRRRRSGAACAPPGEPALADDERFADLGARDRNRGILIPILQAAFERRTVSEWVDLMSAHKVPCAPVNDILELSPTPRPLPATPWPGTSIRPSGWFAPSTQPCGSTGLASHLEERPSSASTRRKSSPMCAATRGSASSELAALGVLGQLEPTAAEP